MTLFVAATKSSNNLWHSFAVDIYLFCGGRAQAALAAFPSCLQASLDLRDPVLYALGIPLVGWALPGFPILQRCTWELLRHIYCISREPQLSPLTDMSLRDSQGCVSVSKNVSFSCLQRRAPQRFFFFFFLRGKNLCKQGKCSSLSYR